MNNFTKEELEQIEYGLLFAGMEDEPALLKIQSLIDNYCEHEWRCWDDEHNTHECIKCDEKRQGEIE